MKKLLCFSLFLCILTTFVCINATAESELPSLGGDMSCVLVNIETGTEIYGYNAEAVRAAGASSRLMTAMVTYDVLRERMDERVMISSAMVQGYENYNSFYTSEWKSLADYVGSYITYRDLFELALVYSADDAVQALAVAAFGDTPACVDAMNEKASVFGMTETLYSSVLGSGSLSRTTAADVARLSAKFCSAATLYNMASSQSADIAVGTINVRIYNRNLFNSSYYGTGYYDSTIGGLLYHSASGCLISKKTDENLSYVCVVMGGVSTPSGAGELYTMSSSLLNYGVDNFGFVEVLSELKVFADIPVKLSKQADFVTVVPKDNLLAFLNKEVNVQKDVTYDVELSVSELDAPVSLGETVGYVDVMYKGESLGRVELVTNASVSKSLTAEFSDFAHRVLTYPLTVIFLIVCALGAVAYVLHRAQKEQNDR